MELRNLGWLVLVLSCSCLCACLLSGVDPPERKRQQEARLCISQELCRRPVGSSVDDLKRRLRKNACILEQEWDLEAKAKDGRWELAMIRRSVVRRYVLLASSDNTIGVLSYKAYRNATFSELLNTLDPVRCR